MIGRIRGLVWDKSAEGALIDVGGVGYDVVLPLSTLATLPAIGAECALWIHTHVREEELRLFGFATRTDRTAFRTMLKVSGVGPKAAIAVIGALSGAELARAVESADTRRLTTIPGIGKKTAERIILELGGKLTLDEAGAPTAPGPMAELGSALTNLGFKQALVDKVLARLEQEEGGADRPFEELLRRALTLVREK